MLPLLGICLGGFPSRTDGQFPVPQIDWSPREYVCYRTQEAPAIDGRLTESCWVAARWTEDFIDIEGSSRPTPRFRTRARMLWDDTHFYVGAQMEEPHVWGTLTDRDAVIFHDNDFEVFIDADGDTHTYCELEINALGTEWDLLLVKPYRDGGPAVHAWDIPGLRTAVFVEGTLNHGTDRDRGWSVEIAFPWEALRECAGRPAPPLPGDQWRVNFSRVEWQAAFRAMAYMKLTDPETGKPYPEDNWVWSPQGVINMHYPEMWGFVQFSSREVRSGTEHFAPRLADTAAWALRRIYYGQRIYHLKHGRYSADLSRLPVAAPSGPRIGWPPTLAITPTQFEAYLTLPGGERVHIAQDGRTWTYR